VLYDGSRDKKKKELLEALALMAANNGSVGFGFHCVKGGSCFHRE
jgi:hypothetical protein